MRPRWKLLRILMVVLFLLGASACGSDDDDEGGGGAQDDTEIKTDVGVSATEITIGQITDTSGVFQVVGKPLTEGQRIYWEHVNNDLNGVAGRKIKLVVEDHGYNPQTAQAKYAGMKDQVLMLSQLLGTPITNALLDSLNEDRILTSPASLSSALAREELLIMTGSPYRFETLNAVDYIVNELDKPNAKIAIIYQNDDYGQDGLLGAKDAVEAYDDIELVAEIPYNPTATEFSEQIAALRDKKPEYVLLTGGPRQLAGIAGGAAAERITPQYIINGPAYSPSLLATAAKPVLDQYVKISTSAAYWGEDVPGMKELLDAVKKFGAANQAPDNFLIFGWTQAKIVHEVLKQAAENGDLTREGVIKAFSELGEIDLGGLLPDVSYGATPDERIPSRQTRISEIQPDDPAYVTGVKPITEYYEAEAAKDIKV